jgi:hypothetical protein
MMIAFTQSAFTQLAFFLKYLVLYPFVVSAIAFVTPHANPDLARTITWTVVTHDPLYKVDELPNHEGERTAALLVATAAHESSFRESAVGDGGRSYGYFQLWERPGLTPLEQATEALRQMRVSLAMCGDMAAYISGRCDVPRAQKLAAMRENLSLRIFSEVQR